MVAMQLLETPFSALLLNFLECLPSIRRGPNKEHMYITFQILPGKFTLPSASLSAATTFRLEACIYESLTPAI